MFSETLHLTGAKGQYHRAAPPYGSRRGIDWEQIEQRRRVHFKVIHVPGDDLNGIEPFYLSQTEVTWEMFAAWAFGIEGEVGDQSYVRAGLRPSKMSGIVVDMGMQDRPVISLSAQAAEAYCIWLSEQTGRRYRLPTEAEWHHALSIGGGVPTDVGQLLATAYLADNAQPLDLPAPPEAFDPFADIEPETERAVRKTAPVASREPNVLGLYDMLGNAAEWVTTDTGHALVGGHYDLPAADLTPDWRVEPDADAWDATSPNRWSHDHWYHTVLFQGFRLVCEPVNFPEISED
ncbi:MAG: SUMF1/EgtB/PvdO family nonheme iron enzyme [Planctomycetota bacterium]